MWNLILRTLRKKPDVTVTHTAENNSSFIVTISPHNRNHPKVDDTEIRAALNNYLGRFSHYADIEVQEIG